MSGTLLDQRVFEQLVQRLLPMLHEHLVETEVQLSVASLPWFLSLYINSMPLVFAFRICDCFMAMGPRVLFQIGLAILKINGEALLEVTDDGAFLNLMKSYFASLGNSAHPDSPNPKHRQITKFQELLVVAFREFGSVTEDTITAERRRFRTEIIQEIELFAKRSAVRNLHDMGRFSKDEAGLIYDQLVEAIYRAKHLPRETPAQAPRTGGRTTFGAAEQVPIVDLPGLLGNSSAEVAGSAAGGVEVDVENDYKEMRITLPAFRLFLGEVATWARDEYIVSNGFQQRIERKVPEHETVERLFHWWDTDGKGWLSLQDVVTGLDRVMHVEGPLEAISWLFDLHAATYGRGRTTAGADGQEREAALTQTELLKLSETLLFFFRNEPGDAYLGAVSRLIADAYREGQAEKAQALMNAAKELPPAAQTQAQAQEEAQAEVVAAAASS